MQDIQTMKDRIFLFFDVSTAGSGVKVNKGVIKKNQQALRNNACGKPKNRLWIHDQLDELMHLLCSKVEPWKSLLKLSPLPDTLNHWYCLLLSHLAFNSSS